MVSSFTSQAYYQFNFCKHNMMMLLPFFILFLSSIQPEFKYFAHARLLFSNCSANDTYTIGSTFESNLFNLLSSLSKDAQINSAFSNESFGNSPDKVYGLLMCFVDSTLADCVNCLQYATANTTQSCSMSATAIVFYDSCLLSYSNNNFLTVADPYVPYCLYSGASSLDSNTANSLMQVLTNLSTTVPYTPEMFSKEDVTGTKIEALMQCTRDLSPVECGNCISNAMSYFSSCSINRTALGMRILTRNCYIRYESYAINATAFPKSLVPPPPSPPPPSPPPPPAPISPSGGSVLLDFHFSKCIGFE